MNYKRIYEQIIAKRKTVPVEGYSEIHHIVPLCVGGSNDEENLVVLTAREHFICHWLLVKMYDGAAKIKLACAFNNMCRVDGVQQRRSKNFEIARKLFSENHPTKDPDVKRRISESLKKYYAEHPIKLKRVTKVCPWCSVSFETQPSNPKRFCSRQCAMDQLRVNPEANRKRGEALKKTLSKMSKEDMVKRMAPTRNLPYFGERVSKAKKGKKTNQPQLERIKYGTMSEEEFQKHISGRRLNIQSRMIRRRNEYLYGTKSNT